MSHLTQVAHDLQVLYIQLVTSVGINDLRALPSKPIAHISPEEPCAAEDCGDDTTDLHSPAAALLAPCARC